MTFSMSCFSLGRLGRVMPKRSMIVLSAALVAGVSLGGCSSTSPAYYSLDAQDGPVHQMSMNSAQPIEVLLPSVPDQLDRDTVVRSIASYRMQMIGGASWSEPLGTLIGHTLAADLVQRLPGRVVFSQNDNVSTPPQVVLALSVSRFDVGEDGHALVEGILSVQRRADGTGRSVPVKWVSPQRVGGGPRALAVSLSQGVSALADQAVSLLD